MLRQVCLSLSPTLPNYVSTCSVVCVCLSSLVFFLLSRRLCPSLALSLRRGSRRRSLSDLAVGVQALREFYPTDGFSAAPAFFLGRTEQHPVSLALVLSLPPWVCRRCEIFTQGPLPFFLESFFWMHWTKANRSLSLFLFLCFFSSLLSLSLVFDSYHGA